MNWSELRTNSLFKNVPYKVELNEWGQVVLTPVGGLAIPHRLKIAHSISKLLTTGQVLMECAVQTPKGTKVADVAWASPARWSQIIGTHECTIPPDICVEILSDGNAMGELLLKKDLYLQAGAVEVWICDHTGIMAFHQSGGQFTRSALVPDFPAEIQVY